MQAISIQAQLQRKDPRPPVYVVVPFADVEPWRLTGTTVVEGSANGHDFGRRTLKRWSSAAEADWFLEFTAPYCKLAGIAVGDRLELRLQLAGNEPPLELAALLREDAALRAAWEGLSDAARRAGQEHIRTAKSPATRVKRAAAPAGQLRAKKA